VVTTTPVVMAGPGIQVGERLADVAQADIAPTIAALLGLPRPSHAFGTALPVLDAEVETLAEIREAHRVGEGRFASRAATALGRDATSLAGFDRARRSAARGAWLIRIPLAAAALLMLAWVWWRTTRRRHAGAVAAGVAAFVGVWAALFFGRGLTFSFSHFNTEAQIEGFLLARLIDAVIAGLVGGVVAGVVAGWRRSPAPFRDGVATAMWSMFLVLIVVAAFFAAYGWTFSTWLPDMSAAFFEYLALLAVLGLGLTAGAIGLASMGIAGIVARRGSARVH
jgi:hypothetical protein